MIENSERGVTLNKSLAWTILVTLIGGGIWIGTQVTDAKNGVDMLQARQAEDRQDISQNTSAVNTLQSGAARLDQRLISIEQGQRRTEDKIDTLIDYISNGSTPK
jgi:uncharacterized protein YlxW (UPF0749 family)